MSDLGWNYSSFFEMVVPLHANITLVLVYHSESGSDCQVLLAGSGYNIEGPYLWSGGPKDNPLTFYTSTPGQIIMSCDNPDCWDSNMNMLITVQ